MKTEVTSSEKKSDALRCSFCNKSQRDVQKLIAGPTVYICNECVDICIDIIAEDRPALQVTHGPLPQLLINAADASIPGQSSAKRLIAAALAEHAMREPSSAAVATPLLIGGPVGTGKQELVRAMAGAIDLPFAVIEVPLLFANSPFKHTHDFSGFDKRPGVIVLNHIDAIAMDVTEQDKCLRVQQSLISILDGAEVQLATATKSVVIDTKRVLFIAVGTFDNAMMTSEGQFDAESLLGDGYLPELVARFGVSLMLERLAYRDLKEFLIREGGLIEKYRERFAKHGLTVRFDDSAIDLIVRHGERRNTGIRGLRTTMDSLSLALACEPLHEGQSAFLVDRDFVGRTLH